MRILLFIALITLCFGSFAQNADDDYPSTTAGILGAVNFSKFNIKNGNAEYKFDIGYSGGVWVNVPLGKVGSFEPQIMYSAYNYKPKSGAVNPNFDGSMQYLSIPLLVKLRLTKHLGVTFGPQFDYLLKVSKDDAYSRGDFAKNSTYLTGGVEVTPRGRLTIFGRYLHGTTDLDHSGSGLVPSRLEFYNRHIQAGLKFKLLGKKATPPPPPAAPVPPPPPAPEPVKEVDTDGDGINDTDDKCPTEAGTAKYNGCPVPDTDGDGINDDDDKCPTIAGVKENDGCPAIPKLNAASIQFVTGSSKLTAGAVKELDDIVSYMKEYPEVTLQVNGHTDNVGKEELNQTLSEKRAASVVDALVKKGVDASKLTSEGFGMSQPVADNSTPAGRTKNRRVEFKFSQQPK